MTEGTMPLIPARTSFDPLAPAAKGRPSCVGTRSRLVRTGMTRSFRDTVADRARRSPGFVAALVEEARQALADGDTETAHTLLRDVANATRP